MANIIGSVAGNGNVDSYSILGLANDSLELVQATLQTVFIFEASKRCLMHVNLARQNNDRRQSAGSQKQTSSLHFDKPGREMLTLLLAVNFGQWAIDVSAKAGSFWSI